MDKARTSRGWIALDRSLLDHWTWQVKPFGVGQAWIDLLLMASYKDGTELYHGKLVERKRGEMNVSITWLTNRWGWLDRKKTRRTLKHFEEDGMISLSAGRHGTTITIENYAFFQDVGTTIGQPLDNHWTTIGHTKTKEQGNKSLFPLGEEEQEATIQAEAERLLDKHRPGWREELDQITTKGGPPCTEPS